MARKAKLIYILPLLPLILLCSNKVVDLETIAIDDINNLHNFSYSLSLESYNIDAKEIIPLSSATIVDSLRTIYFESDYIYNARKEVLIDSYSQNLNIKYIQPILDELVTYDFSFLTSKIKNNDIVTSMKVDVDGKDNKFGVYGFFYGGVNTIFYKGSSLINIDGESKIFNFSFYVFDNPTFSVKYFQNLDEYYSYIDGVNPYENN